MPKAFATCLAPELEGKGKKNKEGKSLTQSVGFEPTLPEGN